MNVVRLSVPGTLLYRDVVLRVVGSMCRLVRNAASKQETGRYRTEFDDKVVSAVGEAFNNVVIHAYARASGVVALELTLDARTLTVRMSDTGEGFDLPAQRSEGLESPRESHMGLEIIMACMDEVTYVRGSPGAPNVLTMTKHYVSDADASTREA